MVMALDVKMDLGMETVMVVGDGGEVVMVVMDWAMVV